MKQIDENVDLTETYEIKKRECLSEKEYAKVDAFIMKRTTTGEFINTLNYMDYHPQNRFKDDSIVIFDKGSQEVRGVMLAATEDSDTVISHPGTTFAGLILDRKAKLSVLEAVVDIMLGYYEKEYQTIIIKSKPDCYMIQPFHIIDYLLLQRGYLPGFSGLSNVIDIRTVRAEEDIFALFDSVKRNQVRKVLKEKKFRFSVGDEIREDVWQKMNENLKRKFDTQTTHTLQEIRELKRRCFENIKSYYVDTIDGEYGAFALVFLFKNVFHTQYLDVNYQFTGQYPNLLLVLEMIKEAAKNGYSYFSFGASTEKQGAVLNRGLYHYKAGYGGGEILLPVYKMEKT